MSQIPLGTGTINLQLDNDQLKVQLAEAQTELEALKNKGGDGFAKLAHQIKQPLEGLEKFAKAIRGALELFSKFALIGGTVVGALKLIGDAFNETTRLSDAAAASYGTLLEKIREIHEKRIGYAQTEQAAIDALYRREKELLDQADEQHELSARARANLRKSIETETQEDIKKVEDDFRLKRQKAEDDFHIKRAKALEDAEVRAQKARDAEIEHALKVAEYWESVSEAQGRFNTQQRKAHEEELERIAKERDARLKAITDVERELERMQAAQGAGFGFFSQGSGIALQQIAAALSQINNKTGRH